jgi:hypothetical protein
MYGMGIQVVDGATPVLVSLAQQLNSRDIRAMAGRSGANTIRNHLFALDAERANPMGWPRTHFYADAARSTNSRVVDDGAIVAINKTGICQRYFGGWIYPVNTSWLAIPARSEAYGHRAREFSFLQVVFFKGGLTPGALVDRERQDVGISNRKDRRKGHEGQRRFHVTPGQQHPGELVWYWLVKSVWQDKDPGVLPDDAALGAAVLKSMSSYVNRLLAGVRAARAEET